MNEYGYIYCLEALNGPKTGWKYVGQSVNENRKKIHLAKLRRNNHHSKKLQNYYNKYGENSLKFYVLLKCDEQELNFWEIHFINNIFDSYKNGFNCTLGGKRGNLKLGKPGVLQSMITNEIISFDSHTKFARKYKVDSSSILGLIEGRKTYTQQWFNPMFPWRQKIWGLVSPKGETVTFTNIKKFSEENKLAEGCVWQVLTGKYQQHFGWTRVDSKYKRKRDGCAKPFKVISPTGEIFEGLNITEFAQKHGLEQSLLTFVINGKRCSHKGWTIPNQRQRKSSGPQTKHDIKCYNPSGELVEFYGTYLAFERKYGLGYSQISNLHQGKKTCCKNWTLTAEKPIKYAKNIKLVAPNGQLVEYYGSISDFAEKYNLKYKCLCALLSGQLKSLKGWTKA